MPRSAAASDPAVISAISGSPRRKSSCVGQEPLSVIVRVQSRLCTRTTMLSGRFQGTVAPQVNESAVELLQRMTRFSADVERLQRRAVMLTTVLIVVLVLLLIGALPTWGYSNSWGYGPGGLLGLVLVVVVILALLGRI